MNVLSVAEAMEFNADRRIRKRLFLTDKIESELVCYEPGQGTAEHHHVVEDELFFIVEGRGTITVDGEEIEVSPTSLVYAPAQSRHSVQAADDSRLVIVFFKAPGRSSRELPAR